MPYDVLPARLRDLIPAKNGQEIMRNVLNSQLEAGKSESVAFASAWAALQRAGYDKDEDGKWIKKSSRAMLENKVEEYNDRYGDKHGRVTLAMLQDVYDRGVGAYRTNPESVRPNVNSPEQWAAARVNSFLEAARGAKAINHDQDIHDKIRKLQPTPSQVHVPGAEWDYGDDDEDDDDLDDLDKAQTYQPPKAAQNAARRVLGWKEKYGDEVKGMTPVGWARARQLASGKPVSLRTVARMSAFNRHRKNATVAPEYRTEPWKDAGHVAWLGWGGNAGMSWAKRTVQSVSKARGAEPIYMYRPVLNAEQIIAWAATQGFSTTLPPDDLHVTVVFSKTPFSAELSRIADQHSVVHHGNIVVRGGKRMVTPLGDKGAVVLKIESAELQNEHAFFRSMGASWDYQEYTPHISITYRGAGMDVAAMMPYPGDIVLGALYAKPMNTNWDSEIAENAVSKRTLNDDTFTTPEEASVRSIDLGLGGAVHVHQTADGMAVYMPGEDHEDYLEAMAERAGIMGEDEDESPDVASTDEDLLTRAVMAIMRVIMEQSVEKRVTILKADDEQRIVWGWASVATVKGMSVLDQQGDMMTPDEMVKMANRFMESARAAKAMHAGDQIGEVIHSLPLTAELAKALGIEADREGWIIGMRIRDDAMWQSVKSGDFGAFSIGGRAKREALV